jgi:hypothetical protein
MTSANTRFEEPGFRWVVAGRRWGKKEYVMGGESKMKPG